jgi:hypothetical protein
MDKDAWYTPIEIIQSLGKFDLDPCCDNICPNPTAKRKFGPDQDGLSKPWNGRVWCNPPFSNVVPWVDRMIAHGNGVLFVFARSDAIWFQRALASSGMCLLLAGRTTFGRPNGTESRCPLGCALIPFGKRNLKAVKESNIRGQILLTESSYQHIGP